MDKLEELLLNSLSKEKRVAYFSRIKVINNTSLIELREQIKSAMLPLLLKVFQLKIHLNTSSEDLNNGESIHKLKMLDKDIKTLATWCQSCSNQIQEVLNIDPNSIHILHSDSQKGSHKNLWSTFYKKFKNKNNSS